MGEEGVTFQKTKDLEPDGALLLFYQVQGSLGYYTAGSTREKRGVRYLENGVGMGEMPTPLPPSPLLRPSEGDLEGDL